MNIDEEKGLGPRAFPEIFLSIDLGPLYRLDFPIRSQDLPLSPDFNYTEERLFAFAKKQARHGSLHVTMTHLEKNQGAYILIQEKVEDDWLKEEDKWFYLWQYTIQGKVTLEGTRPCIQALLEKRERQFEETEEYKKELAEIQRFQSAPLSFLCRDYIECEDGHEKQLKKIEKFLAQCSIEDINAPCTQGFTALHWAAMHRNNELIKRLLSLKANPYLKNIHDRMPIDYYTHELSIEDFKDMVSEAFFLSYASDPIPKEKIPEFREIYIDEREVGSALCCRSFSNEVDLSLFKVAHSSRFWQPQVMKHSESSFHSAVPGNF